LEKVPELGTGEGGTQVSDDSVRHSESVCNLLDELDRLGGACSPLGELVDGDEYMSEAVLCRLEWSYRVEFPACEWLGWRNRPQGLSRDVLLLGEELASMTPNIAH